MKQSRKQASVLYHLGLLIWAVGKLLLLLVIGSLLLLLALPALVIPLDRPRDELFRALKWLGRL